MPTLTDRVRARVAEAGHLLEQRESRGRPRSGARRPARGARPAASRAQGSENPREVRSMRWVYREMRTTYRRYRRETGMPAVPALRDAVVAFKEKQSLPALVAVASFLDDRHLLPW